MMGLGIQELAIIMVVVMVIFGAGKLPDMMKDLGATVRELKTAEKEMKEIEKL